MIWPFRRREHNPIPAHVAKAHAESAAGLEESKQLRRDAAEVGSSLRESRARNNFADSFRVAMGGTT